LGSLLDAKCSSCDYRAEGLLWQTGFAGVLYEPKNCCACRQTVSVAVESVDVGGPFAKDLPELNSCPRCGGKEFDDLELQDGAMSGQCPRCGSELVLSVAGIWD
jgi:ssDNA-binding Zn-finger/Zn-ribbon topoisomerase 1